MTEVARTEDEKVKQPMLFLDWFLDQYEVGLPNPETFQICSAYLQGLLDATPRDENRANLMQCISSLRSSEVIVRVLKQYQVRMPYG
jgi:hypothetical protein